MDEDDRVGGSESVTVRTISRTHSVFQDYCGAHEEC